MAELLKKGDILLGKYRVEGLAGRGTFGEVYHVLHPKQLSPRAIKVLRKDMPGVGSTDIQDARSRFEMEARLGDRLTHPNVIKVLEFEDEGDELYLIMEYAPGGSLKDRLKKGPLSTNEAVRLGVEVCAGLQAIHERLHAVHRDIKPSNILFDGDGTARICDLGLVQLAGDESRGSRLGSLAGSQPGTPPYMSPEQENTKGYLTPSSDLFSVGCVLFEALTGKLYKDYLGTRVRDHRKDIPDWLDVIVAKALEEMPGRIPADDREQSRRYRTSLIMQGDLEQGQKGERAKQEAERQRLAELAAAKDCTCQKAEEASWQDTELIRKEKTADVEEEQRRQVEKKLRQEEEDRRGRQVEEEQKRNPAGIEWVEIPAGGFLYGEKREKKTIFKPYLIGKYPITNEQYKLFLDANPNHRLPGPWDPKGRTYPSGKARHPVVGVGLDDAQEFCKWANCRLPVEEEWEKAARGTDGRTYPWGEAAPNADLLNFNDNVRDSTAVDQYPKGVSPYGIWDMSGNVSEYTATPHDMSGNVSEWFAFLYEKENWVARGCSWSLNGLHVRSSYRFGVFDPTYLDLCMGFRCVRDTSP